MTPTALITGGTRGIGAAIARELEPTHHLLIGGTDPAHTTEASKNYRSAEPFIADLASAEATAEAAAKIQGLDVLIHSAGISNGGRVDATSREEWRRGFELNVVAVADLTRLLLPQLRASKGLVVMINSGSGYTSHPGSSVYCATKFALRAFTDALREEERGQIRVSSIHPGRVDTDMQREIQAARGKSYNPDDHMRPESVAKAVRLAVETTDDAVIESLTIRPS